jgi:hypothetical protein
MVKGEVQAEGRGRASDGRHQGDHRPSASAGQGRHDYQPLHGNAHRQRGKEGGRSNQRRKRAALGLTEDYLEEFVRRGVTDHWLSVARHSQPFSLSFCLESLSRPAEIDRCRFAIFWFETRPMVDLHRPSRRIIVL